MLKVILGLAILQSVVATDGSDDDYSDRDIAVEIGYMLNDITRLHEKYVLQKDKVLCKSDKEVLDEYDFIIVGGGSAGCAAANRLTEIPEWKVLLIEAGDLENSYSKIPMVANTLQGSKYDWGLETEPLEKIGTCLKDRKMKYPRGKVLGGSSSINYMMYVRGNPVDYDHWRDLGNEGWSYKDVLPYFLKSEQAKRLIHENQTLCLEPEFHNTDGCVSVENSYTSQLIRLTLEAGKEVGLNCIDYNAPTNSFGLSPMQATIRHGSRESSARAYLKPIACRPNLTILTNALVTKILINDKNEVYGVTYERDGKNHTVLAIKEVILSAGTIKSPHLLMVSGIGPKENLEKVGIEVVKELPVGQNLQDHLTFYGSVHTIPYDKDQTALWLIKSFPSYIFNGSGPLTNIGGIQGVGLIHTDDFAAKIKQLHSDGSSSEPEQPNVDVSGDKTAHPNSDVPTAQIKQPNIELVLLGGSLAASSGFFMSRVYGMLKECYNSVFKSLEPGFQYTIAPVLLHPRSKGYLRIVSTNIHEQLLIQPEYFTDPEDNDMKTMIAGIRAGQALFDTQVFKEFGAKLSEHKVLGCEEEEFNSDEYWGCALRAMANTLYHPIGTCKMGPEEDPGAVVNNRLEVYGIKKLRVADCSIMPTHISGHTNAAAMMIGEKVSDLIKDKYAESEQQDKCDESQQPDGCDGSQPQEHDEAQQQDKIGEPE